MKRSTPTLFIYCSKGASCNRKILYWLLHGRYEVRTSADEFGRSSRREFEYRGIPHFDVIRGVIAVEAQHERRVVEMFEKYRVPYIRAKVREGTKS